ncbi:MAG TPA: methylated-DNA--[protein]-cysteine S-methyltransferase [Bacteroidales bacterium]|jgi:AraC family transcriptional regulator of adaptative response/methylated-DNA-[protein]-cysteine methyltransferase|nr:methylated-DNA--[protein]-cysteine S-methyltransferase [Bacteroidales bacterium]
MFQNMLFLQEKTMITFNNFPKVKIRLLASTDKVIRSQADEGNICYGQTTTLFGNCFTAFKDEAMCMLHFTDNPQASLEELKTIWKNSKFIEDNSLIENKMQNTFNGDRHCSLTICVKGSSFRIKVWKTLIEIPIGKLISYEDLAKLSLQDKAVRAVATAVANNPVALLIPCHRIVRKNGNIGNYRWGSDLKEKLINWEKSLSY